VEENTAVDVTNSDTDEVKPEERKLLEEF